eukprot:m.36441 g.36441  ORF g.36441 m.36441 type:complete len:349 (+) comp17358_c0_seq1:229-1275(+)
MSSSMQRTDEDCVVRCCSGLGFPPSNSSKRINATPPRAQRSLVSFDELATPITFPSPEFGKAVRNQLCYNGWMIVKLANQKTATSIRQPITPIRNILKQLPRVHDPENPHESVSASAYKIQQNLHPQIDAARYVERCQLRFLHPLSSSKTESKSVSPNLNHGGQIESTVTRLHACCASFMQISQACFQEGQTVIGTNLADHFDAQSVVLDSFLYDNKRCIGADPSPSHVDPGIITMLADDVPGLEVYDEHTHTWSGPIILQKDEVIVMVNRHISQITNGRIKACRHRVSQITGDSDRVSIVFEIKPNLTGARAVLDRFETSLKHHDKQSQRNTCCCFPSSSPSSFTWW